MDFWVHATNATLNQFCKLDKNNNSRSKIETDLETLRGTVEARIGAPFGVMMAYFSLFLSLFIESTCTTTLCFKLSDLFSFSDKLSLPSDKLSSFAKSSALTPKLATKRTDKSTKMGFFIFQAKNFAKKWLKMVVLKQNWLSTHDLCEQPSVLANFCLLDCIWLQKHKVFWTSKRALCVVLFFMQHSGQCKG